MSEKRVGGRSQSTKIILTIVGLLCAPVVGAVVATYFAMAFTFIIRGAPPSLNPEIFSSAITIGTAMGIYLGWPTAFMFG